ncbi:hypothetical protein CR513_29991, partial [Mucuna pruriens]
MGMILGREVCPRLRLVFEYKPLLALIGKKMKSQKEVKCEIKKTKVYEGEINKNQSERKVAICIAHNRVKHDKTK